MSSRDDDDLAPPTEEELREAEALRAALETARTTERGAALLAAFSPRTLSHQENERLLERALGGVPSRQSAPPGELGPASLVPEPTAAEVRDASRLRVRVDAGLRADPDAEPDDAVERLVDVAIALRVAHDPRPLDELTEARLRRGALASPAGRRRAIGATIVALAVAAAAAFAIVPRVMPDRGAPATASLVRARSTQDLFDPAEPFPREGGTSARIDRIATSRGTDLRENRYARWGIR